MHRVPLNEYVALPPTDSPIYRARDLHSVGARPTVARSAALGAATRRLPAHIAAKIQRDPQTGCWLWTGARDSRGYGNVRVGRRVRKAHRVVYELVRGPVGPGLDCDHLCRQASCVRPSHIEPVPHRVNVQRGAASTVPGARQRARTHCPHGHAYSPDNTYIQPSTGGRCCRACDRDKKQARIRPVADRVCAQGQAA